MNALMNSCKLNVPNVIVFISYLFVLYYIVQKFSLLTLLGIDGF
jgi:uncharacterized membrane protein (GlpM family)